jgi:gamma-glutamyltranspeptidase/glutathione hydrolase
MIRGARAAASEGVAANAAQAVIDAGGTAVDAVIAGFFGAAGASEGVLFAPAVAIVAGFGAGGRLYDGRPAQPGKGAPRPRGFVDEASIPAAARVAVPRSIGMLMLLSGVRGRATLSELARAGVESADASGNKKRAALIRRVGAAGVLALRAPEIERALLAAGGVVAGGALTAADLEETAPSEGEAAATSLEDNLTVYTPPFAADPAGDAVAEAIVACDGRGTIAALAYVPARKGLAIPDLEISLDLSAVPVRRGVTRVSPGTVLPARAPIAIAVQPGSFSAAVGLPGAQLVDPGRVGALAKGAAAETALAELRESAGARAAIAVVTDGKTARVATG